jgi:MoxR-like ATPase
MHPHELTTYLARLVEHDLKISTMIWGPPGIGKSSIVAQTAETHGLEFIDVRLSQLAPTDLRGLPVPDNGVSRWYPPEFLPREGGGILFLDELNMAPPTIQGMAQQLILDRRVGSYVVPTGWFIWAAGNRKEDRAAVFDMPAPLANRFLHLEVEPDFSSFKQYALERGLHEQILAFLSFRSALLHRIDPQQPAWPSPRSWEMASRLHGVGLAIAPVVGHAAAAEFNAFIAIYNGLPDLEAILRGDGSGLQFPDEPSQRYALTTGLCLRARDAGEAYRAFGWLVERASNEWVQLFGIDLFRLMRSRGQMGELARLVGQDERLQAFMAEYRQLMMG